MITAQSSHNIIYSHVYTVFCALSSLHNVTDLAVRRLLWDSKTKSTALCLVKDMVNQLRWKVPWSWKKWPIYMLKGTVVELWSMDLSHFWRSVTVHACVEYSVCFTDLQMLNQAYTCSESLPSRVRLHAVLLLLMCTRYYSPVHLQVYYKFECMYTYMYAWRTRRLHIKILQYICTSYVYLKHKQ